MQLAKRLDVPWGMFGRDWCGSPLVSVKQSECETALSMWSVFGQYDMFLHDVLTVEPWVRQARRVFTANSAIANEMRAIRPDVIPAWCPSMVEAQPREPITVLSFGMANKLRTDHYETLKAKLDATCENYVVYVSAGLHEGTTFADAHRAFNSLRRLFGNAFVFLGTLSDEAMVDRLRTCTYVAAFFEKGLRENNTSVMAALDAGAKIITNHDQDTPTALKHMTHDINAMAVLPHAWLRERARFHYGWDKLVDLIRHA